MNRRPTSFYVLVLGVALPTLVLAPACKTRESNPHYCAALGAEGDATCIHRYEGGSRPYCIIGTDVCVNRRSEEYAKSVGFDGCVESEPSRECHSPCGDGQSWEQDHGCSSVETSATGETGGTGGTGGTRGTEGATGGAPPQSSTSGDIWDVSTTDSSTTGCVPAEDFDWNGCLGDFGQVDVESQCGSMSADCLLFPFGVATHSACSSSCTDACDCPAAGSSAAVPSCAHLPDGDDEMDCYLDCSADPLNPESCPVGWQCMFGYICMEPEEPAPLYGSCSAVACEQSDVCATNESGYSVCTRSCSNDDSCASPQFPGFGVNASCDGVVWPPAGRDCYLSCSIDRDCPTGMHCVAGHDNNRPLCMWPPMSQLPSD